MSDPQVQIQADGENTYGERLFDPVPFSRPRRNYRDEKVAKPKPTPEIHRVELGAVWRLFSAEDHAEVHARGDTGVTLCEQAISSGEATRGPRLIPLTFTPGTPAAACLECWKRGAR
jgi:hypothetical protein